MVEIKKNLIEKKKLEASLFTEGVDIKDYNLVLKKYKKLSEVLHLHSLLLKFNSSKAVLIDELYRFKGGVDYELENLVQTEITSLGFKTSFIEKIIKGFFTCNEVFVKTKGVNIIVEIRSGTGGEEASLFVSILYKMYVKYLTNLNIKYTRIHYSSSEKGGLRYVCLKIYKNVSNFLRFEPGVHRIQRVPVTESSGRVHTSTATVAVLPEADEVEVDLKEEELKITVCKSSGPGGQGVNTTDSAVQIIHKPTGLTATCSDQRTQQKNKTQALSVLRTRLLNLNKERCEREYSDFRKKQIGFGLRSEKVRTYNFTKNRITDHRTGVTVFSLEKVIGGDIDELYSKLTND